MKGINQLWSQSSIMRYINFLARDLKAEVGINELCLLTYIYFYLYLSNIMLKYQYFLLVFVSKSISGKCYMLLFGCVNKKYHIYVTTFVLVGRVTKIFSQVRVNSLEGRSSHPDIQVKLVKYCLNSDVCFSVDVTGHTNMK